MSTRFLPLIIACLAALTLPRMNGEGKEPISHRIAEVVWGEALKEDKRPPFDPAALGGKVVIVEEFGVRIPDCLKRIKELDRLVKRQERAGGKLQVVLIHRQNEVPDEEVAKAVAKIHPSIAVRKAGFLPVFVEGMPNAAIFDDAGLMRWTGNPDRDGFAAALRKVMAPKP